MKKTVLAALLLLVTLTGCISTAAIQPDPTNPPPETLPAPTAPAAAESFAAQLSREEAIATALKDAGLEESQVSRLKAEFDSDDGVPQYDVEFKHDGWEYEYEIHAESGKILSRDKDFDD